MSIGRAYLAAGFEQQAAAAFRQALRTSRGARTRLAIGLAFLSVGRDEEANAHFAHILKSRDGLANAALGDVLIETKREVDAIPYLEHAVALGAFNPHVYLSSRMPWRSAALTTPAPTPNLRR